MSNLVPEGWSIKSISDIATVGSSKRILQSEYVEHGVPFFRSKEAILRSKKIPISYPLYISRERFDEIKARFGAPAKDEILITAVGTIGVIYLIEDIEFYFKDGNLLWIRKVDSRVSSSYLAKYLASDVFQESITRITSGSSQAALTIEKLSELEFNLPPLPEQQKIAAILTSVDEVIEKTQAQIDKIKELKSGMMQELLTHGVGTKQDSVNGKGYIPHTEFKDSPVGRIPKSWEVVSIISALESVIDYRGKSPPKSESGIPLLTAKNIRKGYINEEPREYIPIEKYDDWMVRGLPSYGDVFITTEAPLGNVAKVPKYKFAIGQRVLALCPKKTVINTDYLLFVMQGEYFVKQLDLQSTGSTVAGIKQSTFKNILLALPTLEEQQEIAKCLESNVITSEALEKKLSSLKYTKKALMQDLLTGKVRVKVEAS